MRGFWCIALLAIAFVGCKRPAKLEPAQLVFPKTLAQLPSTVDLQFTVDGRPLTNPSYSIPATFDGGTYDFSIQPPTPLRNAYSLQLEASEPGPVRSFLTVTAAEGVFHVLVIANVDPAVDCSRLVSPSDPCHVALPDPNTDSCVVQTIPDGEPCLGECSQLTCQGAECLPANGRSCALPAPSAPLDPVWIGSSFPNDPPAAVINVFDDQGTQYLLVTEQPFGQPMTAELIAEGNDGKERWKVNVGQPDDDPTTSAMVLQDHLILASTSLNPPIQARSLVDGSLAWSSSAVMPISHGNVMAAVQGGSQLVVFGDKIAVFEASTGALLTDTTTFDDHVSLGVSSDGAGRAWDVSIPGDHPGPLEGVLQSFDVHANALTSATGTVTMPTAAAIRVLAAQGDLVISSVGAWSWPDPLAPFLSGDAPALRNVAIRNDGTIFMHSITPGSCPSTAFEVFDATLQTRLSSCELQSASVMPVSLTEDGAWALLMRSVGQTWQLVVLGADGTATAVLPLNDAEDIQGAALVGSRLFVTGPPALLAYDLPNIKAATHGWVCEGGSPMRQYAPQ